MAMSDPLADMLTRIRNASMVKFDSVSMPSSKLKVGVAALLKQEGYINDFSVATEKNRAVLTIDLKYDDHSQAVITGLKRVSKPGRRAYVRHDRIGQVMSGLGVALISTSKGIVTDRQARELHVGGEVLCHVW